MAGEIVFVCAHGAGGHMNDAGMLAADQALRGLGVDVLRFNFPYRNRGPRNPPDPMPRLMEHYRKVADQARAERAPRKLLIGGRSMGGRVATMLAAEGYACDGVLLLAYPLHPKDRPEKLRDAHLARVRAPVLCFNGTQDELCRRDLMENVLKGVPPSWQMVWIEGATHALRGAGVMEQVSQRVRDWLPAL